MECTFSGNYRKGNRASKKLFELNAFLKRNFDDNREEIDQLIESDHPNVFLWISNVALDMDYRTDEVIDKIKKISDNKNLGLIAFGAGMQLKTRKIK